MFYVVMELLAWLCHIVLIAAGFKLHSLGGISYYTFNMAPQQLVHAISKPLASRQRLQAASTHSSSAGMFPANPPASCGCAAAQDSSFEADALPLVFLHGVGAPKHGMSKTVVACYHLPGLSRAYDYCVLRTMTAVNGASCKQSSAHVCIDMALHWHCVAA